MNHKNIILRLMCFSLVVCTQFSCTKLVNVDFPINLESEKSVYQNDLTANTILLGIYGKIGAEGYDGAFTGLKSITVGAGLSSDEFEILQNAEVQYSLKQSYTNALTGSFYGRGWSLYETIYEVNSNIEGLISSQIISPKQKVQLISESKFIRAYCYFYLTNLYGKVPLTLSTDYKLNLQLYRSSTDKIYSQILSDLSDAETNLPEKYVGADGFTTTTERARPNKWAAKALLARTHLYLENWQLAEKLATEIISNTTDYSLETDLSAVFLANSREAIWQIQPSTLGENTKDGILFNLLPNGPNTYSKPIFLNPLLMGAFETGDNRMNVWTGKVTIGTEDYYFPFKYKISSPGQPLSEYLMMLRLGEQYLVRAEARIRQGNLNGGIADLNQLRKRARGSNPNVLPDLNPNVPMASALDAVLQERRVEMFGEWGHRWLDLKRFKIVGDVMSKVTPLKGGTWSNYKQLYPIPNNDLILNPHLAPNNPGY